MYNAENWEGFSVVIAFCNTKKKINFGKRRYKYTMNKKGLCYLISPCKRHTMLMLFVYQIVQMHWHSIL